MVGKRHASAAVTSGMYMKDDTKQINTIFFFWKYSAFYGVNPGGMLATKLKTIHLSTQCNLNSRQRRKSGGGGNPCSAFCGVSSASAPQARGS